jgi:hypothetical protein
MNTEEQILVLKAFANERFGSLRRMSLAIGKSQNYFTEYFAKAKVPPAYALRKLEALGLPMEPFKELLQLSGSIDWAGEEQHHSEEHLPEESARDEYESIQAYGGKPGWLDLPEELRMNLEQRYSLLQMEIEQAEQSYMRAIERENLERNAKIASVVSSFRRSMMRQLLGDESHDGQEF